MVKELIKEKVQKEERIALAELVDEISFDLWERGINLHKVTQSFVGKHKKIHLVRFMELDQENGLVFGSDTDGVIMENNLVIGGFIEKDIKKVTRFRSEETDMIGYKVYFENGYVQIDGIEE